MRLRLATLNVWALPKPVARHVHQRMHAIGEALPSLGADAIAFQEVWLESARERLVAAGQRAGYEHVWHAAEARTGGGLLVLSRLPIESARFIRFTHGGFAERIQHMDYHGGKGCALLELAYQPENVVLATTHLHASYVGDAVHDEYESVRTAQIVELATALAPIDSPVAALGDFNLIDTSRNYRVLTELTGLEDAAAGLGRAEPTLPRDNPYHRRDHVPGRRIDYVFHRDGARRALRPRSVELVFHRPLDLAGEDAAYSDHAGVLAELELGGDPAPRRAPDPEVAALSRDLLQAGYAAARDRRTGQRRWAAGGLVGGLAALGAADRLRRSRRGLLTGALRALAGAGIVGGIGLTGLSELLTPDEAAAFRTAEAQLDALLAARDPALESASTGR